MVFDDPDDFDFEPSEHEPDEWDPEADLRDPDADGITIPTVETDEADVPADILRNFWLIVLILNAAILFVSLAVMILYFWRDVGLALRLFAVGLLCFGLAYYRYWKFMQSEEQNDEDADGAADDEPSVPESLDTESPTESQGSSSTNAESDP